MSHSSTSCKLPYKIFSKVQLCPPVGNNHTDEQVTHEKEEVNEMAEGMQATEKVDIEEKVEKDVEEISVMFLTMRVRKILKK